VKNFVESGKQEIRESKRKKKEDKEVE